MPSCLRHLFRGIIKDQCWEVVFDWAGVEGDWQLAWCLSEINEPSRCPSVWMLRGWRGDGTAERQIRREFSQSWMKICCKSHRARGLLIFHPRKVLRAPQGFLNPKKCICISEDCEYSSRAPEPIDAHVVFLSDKRNPAEAAAWTCVAFNSATASVGKTKCNCWH